MQWQTFSIQLNDLTVQQAMEVEEKLIKLQEELEDKYDTSGGDFIGIDSGVIDTDAGNLNRSSYIK